MDELDELLAALESWADNPAMGSGSRLIGAYRKYKAEPSPLVLEKIDAGDIRFGAAIIDCEGESYIAYGDELYRLPEGEI